jgi:hypothetical protein
MICARRAGIWESGGIGPLILNLLTTWSGPRRQFARFEEKTNILPLPVIEPRVLYFPVRSLESKILEKLTAPGIVKKNL